MPKISVVIGTLGRPELLKPTLEKLVSQNFSANDFEILVVTNGDAHVREVLAGLPKKNGLCIKLVFCPFQWVAPKRNIGIRLAQNPIVAFIDDDCLADSNWLKTISDFFDQNPGIAGVEGKTEKNSRGLFEHATENLKGGLYPTCNLAFKRDLLLQIGGFDETYTYHREDTDLAFKALRLGSIPFCETMRVFHVTRPTAWKSILKEVRWVRGDIRFYKKFPREYRVAFGFPAQGAFKQGILAWFLLLLGLWGLQYSLLWILPSALVFCCAKYWIVLRKKIWTFPQGVVFLVASFIRDLLFIPAMLYYAVLFSGKEVSSENKGWNTAGQFQPEVF